MLHTSQNEIFASGRALYQYQSYPPGSGNQRILINIKVEGNNTTAVLDTGGLYLILDPGLAELIGLAPEYGLLDQTEEGQKKPLINIRGTDIRGVLHRVTLNFPAEEGQSCSIDARQSSSLKWTPTSGSS